MYNFIVNKNERVPKMKNKVEFILNELIKTYLKVQEPISSTALKELSHLNMSPSTIRGYFQILEKKGMIQKEHFASGSYPSVKAMDFYWKHKLPKKIKFFSIDLLEEECKQYNVSALVKIFENQMLKEVYNVKNKFIVLEFEEDETVLKYDENIYNLLKSLKYLNLKELKKILTHYKLYDLLKNIKNFQKKYIINQKLLYNKFNNINFDFLKQVEDYYINYDEKLLIKKYHLLNEEKEIDIYIIGDIYSDFESLFESMKGGENGKTS